MRLLLIVVTFLIVYGSLFPFAIDPGSYHPRLLDSLFHFGLTETSRGDLVENILLFVPFGFLAINVFPGRSRMLRVFLVLSVSFVLAFSLQAAQLVIPGRIPAGSDAVWNLMGCAFGCALGLAPLSRMLRRMSGFKTPLEIPVILALSWLVFSFAPFVPSLDWQLLKDHLKALFTGTPDPLWIGQSLVMWLIVFHFLRRSDSRILAERNYPAIVAVTLASGFLMVGHSVSSEKIIGGLMALAIWFLFKNRIKSWWLAALLLAIITGINFTPFELRGHAVSFSWIPFSGALTGNLFVNVLAVLKKLSLYGSLIWLLVECRLRLRTAAGVTSVLLFVSEYLQKFFVNTKPEITDALLAVALGVAFHLYRSRTSGVATATAEDHSRRISSGPSTASQEDRARDLQPSGPPHYLPGIDGLRAVAALGVFLVHFNQQARLEGELGPFDLARFLANGNTGVALFFVLSGFLLSVPFWRQEYAAGSKLDMRRYFLRRVARILPAYYLCLGGLLAIKIAAGSAPSINNILSHVLFLYNLSDHNILSLNEPFWTLAVEMQFYLLLPLLMLGLRRLDRRVALLWVSGLAVAAYFVNYGLVSYLIARDEWPIRLTLIWPFSLYISGPGSFVLTYSTVAHLTYFLIGIATALMFVTRLSNDSPRGHQPSESQADLVFWSCAVLVLLMLSTPLDAYLQAPHGHYNWPLLPLLLAAMIYATPHATLARAILETRLLRGLGVISYGIYIFHYPIQKLVARGFHAVGLPSGDYWWAFGGLSLAATVAVATASYWLLERPVMGWARGRRAAPSVEEAHGRSTKADPAPEVSPDHRADGDWIHSRVHFRRRQLDKLRAISEKQGISLSAATRNVLADFMSEYGEHTARPNVLRLGGDSDTADDHPVEACRVNLLKWQYDFLLDMAERIDTNIDELLGAMVDRYRVSS